MEGTKLNKHRPFNIYDGHTYFLTGKCYKGIDYFCDDDRKEMFRKVLKESIERFDIKLFSWVVLNNHYHLIFSISNEKGVTSESLSRNEQDRLSPVTPKDSCLVRFVTNLHSITGKFLNEIDQTPGRKIWYQYWDYCLRNKADFWKHLNYIIKNPFKHSLVTSLEKSFQYKYSSNSEWLKRFGVDGLNESFIKYPVGEVFLGD